MDYDQKIQAAMLRQRDASGRTQYQNPEGKMVSGRYIAPNFLEYLSAGLRSAGAGREAQMAGQEAQDLQTQKQDAMKGDMSRMVEALRGTPEKTISAPSPFDTEGAGQFTMPAKKGGLDQFYDVAANSQFPQFQQMGMQGALSSAQEEAKALQTQQQQQRISEILANSTPQEAIRAGIPKETVIAYHDQNLGKAKVKYQDVGGEFMPVDEYGNVPTGLKPMPKTGDPFKDLIVRGADGGLVPNAPLVGAKTGIAQAGKPVVNVTNRIENKAAENIAGQVGPMLKESSTAAEGAVRTLDAAGRIVSAIDAGNVIAGPLANTRVTVRQAAQLLGVGGKDNAEVLANTRATVRGLAEMTLQGRKQMSGQGAITESESKLAEKAMSGDISDLTPAEIKQLAQASARAAQWTIQTHKTRSDAASKLPGMGGLMPFFNTPAMPGNMPEGFKVIE